MTYEEFICYVKNGMEDVLGKNCIVRIHKVLKNNDIELDALTVITKESNISPTIYLNSYYEEFRKGKDAGIIIKEIYELYKEHNSKLLFNVDIFKNYETIKNRIAFKLVNTKNNEKLLQDIPSVQIMDLSMVFYCLLDNDFLGSATALIHDVHMEMWGISKEELYRTAKENTPKMLSCELKNMNDVIREMLIADLQETIYEKDTRYDENCGMPEPEVVAEGLMRDICDMNDAISMYVLTNKQKTNGAACMLYDDVLENFAASMKKDIYILPSSVHEVILVPAAEGIDRNELTSMVKNVNENELDDIDILSDHVYYYSRRDKEISM